jgi:Peptidase A4 family
MRRAFIVVVVVACCGIAAASASAAAGSGRAHARAPIAGKHRVARHLVYSTNWSGYAAHDDTFKSATGRWMQPAADCSAVKGQKETVASFFVGLDGFDSGTVEQTGVDAICIGKTAIYQPWYEFYPARSFNIAHTVQPGDTLTSSVSQNGSTVTVTLSDERQGWSESHSQSAAGLAFSSAEWIAEAPTQQLTNFGSVHFGSASATDAANHTGGINDSHWSNDAIAMVTRNGRTVRATPQNLAANGSSFDDLWQAP